MGKDDRVVADADIRSIAPTAPVEPYHAHGQTHEAMDGIPVLDMEEIAPSPKDLHRVIALNAQALSQVNGPDPLA